MRKHAAQLQRDFHRPVGITLKQRLSHRPGLRARQTDQPVIQLLQPRQFDDGPVQTLYSNTGTEEDLPSLGYWSGSDGTESNTVKYALESVTVSGPNIAAFPPEAPETEGSGAIVCSEDPAFIEEGAFVTLTAPAGSNYQWFLAGAPIIGATDQVLTFDPIDSADAGEYACSYQDPDQGLVLTPALVLRVFPVGSVPTSGLAGLALLAALCGSAGLRAAPPPVF